MPTQTKNEQEPVRAVVRLFALQVLAVVAIATVITVVATLLAGDDRGTLTATLPGSSESSPATPAESSPPPGPAPSSKQPAPTPPPSSAEPTPSETTRQRMRVDVLNQSAGAGAAESTAARLRERGWRIGRVDDFRGTVTTTTVYYPANRRGQARLLAEDLPGSPRLLERFSTLSDSRLSVVLVD